MAKKIILRVDERSSDSVIGLDFFVLFSGKNCSGSNLKFRGSIFDFILSSVHFFCRKEGPIVKVT